MAATKIFYIVNPKLTYVSTLYVLKWMYGLMPTNISFSPVHSVISDSDMFINKYIGKTDKIIMIGYNNEVQDKLKSCYTGYNFLFLHNHVGYASILHSVYQKHTGEKNLTDAQKLYLSHVFTSFYTDRRDRGAYLLNILAGNMSIRNFYNTFKNGMVGLGSFFPIIEKHLEKFSKMNKSVYGLDGLNFVNASSDYIYDYVYKYSGNLDNIILIDGEKTCIYYKKLVNGESELDSKISKFFQDNCSIIDNVDKPFCGIFTTKFLELTKQMKRVA